MRTRRMKNKETPTESNTGATHIKIEDIEDINNLNHSEYNAEAIIIENQNTLDTNDIKRESSEIKKELLDVAIVFTGDSDDEDNDLYCENCQVEFEEYCATCSMLVRILHNCRSEDEQEINNRITQTLPKKFLKIREKCDGFGIFTLTIIPKNVIFGPCDGLLTVQNKRGNSWKIKNNKLVNRENSNNLNWMTYIDSVEIPSSQQNLIAFQYEENLYFRSVREISEGEELVVCFNENVKNLKDETDYKPVKERKLPDVYACLSCCMGFSSNIHLLNHNKRCSSKDLNDEYMDIVQCEYCNIYMIENEYLNYHIIDCLEKYSRQHSGTSIEKKKKSPKLRSSTRSRKKLIINNEKLISRKDTTKKHRKTNEDSNNNGRKAEYKCNTCNQIFAHNQSLYRHVREKHRPNVQKKHQCPKCDFKTNRKFGLTQHLISHSDARNYKCKLCDKTYKQRIALNEHVKDKHLNDQRYECDICGYKTHYKVRIEMHINRHKNIRNYNCDKCDKKFFTDTELNEHKKVHHSKRGEKIYKCTICSYSTDIKQYLVKHLRYHDESKRHKCQICDMTFVQLSGLKAHIKQKHLNDVIEKTFKCKDCDYKTSVKNYYHQHLTRHSDNRAYKCKMCDKSYKQARGLSVHVRNCHVDKVEKDYKCDKCSYKTNSPSNMHSHSLIHRMEKRYKCPKCDYKANFKVLIKKHLPIHENVRPFICDVCNKGYISRAGLNTHINVNHKEKTLKCPDCKYITSTTLNLTRHIQTHRICAICNKKFLKKFEFKRHLSEEHQNKE